MGMKMEATDNCIEEFANIDMNRIDTPEEGQENISGDGGGPELNPLDSMENNQKIPTEVLAKVFSYLTHTEKLVSRLVCTDWNREISSILAKLAHFTVTTGSGHEAILDSAVPWTKIKISDSPGFALPDQSRSFVTKIVLDVSGTDMRDSLRILSRFPQLIDLEMNFKGHYIKREDFVLTSEQFEVLRKQFKEIAGKLENLTVTFPFAKFSTMLDCLTNFFPDTTMPLIKLTLREKSPSSLELGHASNSSNCSMTAVSDIISKSSSTLKYLELLFFSDIRTKLFTELISKLSTLEDLQLESFLIHLDPTQEMLSTDFDIHQHFLKTQIGKGYMKSLILPWCSSATLCQEFLPCLPKNLKFIGNVCKEHMSDEFFSTLSKCETIAIRSRNTTMFNQPCPSIRQFHYCVLQDEEEDEDEWEWTLEEYSQFYNNLSNSLINLVEFVVQCKRSSFLDADLQFIIENFQHLRILEIHSGDTKISDCGVCGVGPKCADELKRTNKLFLDPHVPKVSKNWRLLGSLKRLEKVILLGTSISEVGIYYGLQFGSTLKQMTIETNEKISDWGFHWLGAGNPGLESFDCSFRNGKISSDGPGNLRKQFPMLEATGKFKLVGKKA